MANEKELPDEFSDLQEFVIEFAISDDLQRSTSEDKIAQTRKRELVDKVSPHLDAINGYLDEHDDEQAHLLGRLAEAACEVALEVGWPTETSKKEA